jgi:radical SAM superfamily enzyme YgiQ (UPF0313 family)
MEKPLLYLINPRNLLENISRSRLWNKLRVWPPLSIMTVAGLTPSPWDIEIIDENLEWFDYARMRRPTLVGITAFTCQATRAYQVAKIFRAMGVPVVMGGIHVSLCPAEAQQYADAIVTGEAESVWGAVLDDVLQNRLQPRYCGVYRDPFTTAPARHDLVRGKYLLGALQTGRGCPLNCKFCSVTSFNGSRFRRRPIPEVLDEAERITAGTIFFSDDNLIGTRQDDIAYSKQLFRGMIERGIKKRWTAQLTINFADDDELLQLAKDSGCIACYIGFESPDPVVLKEMHKQYNLHRGPDSYRKAVKRIHEMGIAVTGNFIIGSDRDLPGVAEQIVKAVEECGIDGSPFTTMTPLPGTQLYDQIVREGRLVLDNYPQDWMYYNLVYPTFRYKNLTWAQLHRESQTLYRHLLKSPWHIVQRALRTFRETGSLRAAVLYFLANLNYRNNWKLYDSMEQTIAAREQRRAESAAAPAGQLTCVTLPVRG